MKHYKSVEFVNF